MAQAIRENERQLQCHFIPQEKVEMLQPSLTASFIQISFLPKCCGGDVLHVPTAALRRIVCCYHALHAVFDVRLVGVGFFHQCLQLSQEFIRPEGNGISDID